MKYFNALLKDADPLATQTGESHKSRGSRNPQALYQEMAAAVRDDSFLIDPAWLLDHPERYEQIRALDDRLTAMERTGASESEYHAALARLLHCVQEARAESERARVAAPAPSLSPAATWLREQLGEHPQPIATLIHTWIATHQCHGDRAREALQIDALMQARRELSVEAFEAEDRRMMWRLPRATVQ